MDFKLGVGSVLTVEEKNINNTLSTQQFLYFPHNKSWHTNYDDDREGIHYHLMDIGKCCFMAFSYAYNCLFF